MLKTIYLMRHPHINTSGKMIGRTDVPLSELGLTQALFWKEKFSNMNFKKVFTTSLQRTKKTAKIIVNDKVILEEISLFNEISLGDWEAKSKTYIKEFYSNLWTLRGRDIDSTSPPNGESFIDLKARVIPTFLSVVETCAIDESYLIIAHQAVNRVILSHLMDIPLTEILNIPQSYACLNILSGVDKLSPIEYQECPIQ